MNGGKISKQQNIFEFINRPGLKMDSERNPPTKQENPKNIQKSFINR